MISLIAAVGREGELGFNGDLIWRLPEDLKRFREVTSGHTVLMGHKTFSSLPALLPGRRHVVLTRDAEALTKEAAEKPFRGAANERPEVIAISALFDFLDKYKGTPVELFVIGGGSIYKQSIEMADKIYLTEIEADYPEADVYFPEFDKEHFKKEVVAKGRDEKYDLNYSFVVYTRK